MIIKNVKKIEFLTNEEVTCDTIDYDYEDILGIKFNRVIFKRDVLEFQEDRRENRVILTSNFCYNNEENEWLYDCKYIYKYYIFFEDSDQLEKFQTDFENAKQRDNILKNYHHLIYGNTLYKLGRKNWDKDLYKQYLNTNHWKKLRAAKIDISGRKCENCGSKSRLRIHHNNYECLGRETYDDLTTLCEDCHNRHHNRL